MFKKLVAIEPVSLVEEAEVCGGSRHVRRRAGG